MNQPYCATCGQKTIEQIDATTTHCTNCDARYWNNPKAAVSILFINDHKQLLFSKRAIEPRKGSYDFPGGFVNYGEDVHDAAIREIAEETGVVIQRDQLALVTIYTLQYMPGVSAADIIFVCQEWQGDFVADDDSAALKWKPLSFINDPSFAPAYLGLEAKLHQFLTT